MSKVPPQGAKKAPPVTVGWREWVGLPDLGIQWIKAKVDTGARSSSLHGIRLETFQRRGRTWVRFDVHPMQRDARKTVTVEHPILEFRSIRSSSGHAQKRPVIETEVEVHGQRWLIELTIADRDEMGFRMLLGRQAMRKRLVVDPTRSYLSAKPPAKSKNAAGAKRPTTRKSLTKPRLANQKKVTRSSSKPRR